MELLRGYSEDAVKESPLNPTAPCSLFGTCDLAWQHLHIKSRQSWWIYSLTVTVKYVAQQDPASITLLIHGPKIKHSHTRVRESIAKLQLPASSSVLFCGMCAITQKEM